MRHAAFVLAIVLTVMSGFVVRQVWTLEPAGSLPIQAAADPRIEETAIAFYQALNAYLDSGDDAELRRLLHPAFATHQSGSSWAGTSDDLLRHLDSVRLLYPDIELEAEPESLGNNTVSVTLSQRGAQTREFAGIEIDPADMIGRLDLLRVERGLITERWSSAPMAGQLDVYPSLSIEWPFASNTLEARVQQVSLESAADKMMSYFRHMVLIVTSGEAYLDLTSQSTASVMIWRANQGQIANAAPVAPETIVVLKPMDAVYIPAQAAYRIWDSTSGDTSLIALDFGPLISQAIPAIDPLAEALESALSSGIDLEGVDDRLTLSFGSAMLLPQSNLSSQEVQGLELAWVTGGSLEMTGSGGEVRVRKAGGTRSQLIDGHAQLLPGEAAAAGPGATANYENSGDEPATAWFFSLVPTTDPTNPGNATATPAGPAPTPTRNPTLS